MFYDILFFDETLSASSFYVVGTSRIGCCMVEADNPILLYVFDELKDVTDTTDEEEIHVCYDDFLG